MREVVEEKGPFVAVLGLDLKWWVAERRDGKLKFIHTCAGEWAADQQAHRLSELQPEVSEVGAERQAPYGGGT